MRYSFPNGYAVDTSYLQQPLSQAFDPVACALACQDAIFANAFEHTVTCPRKADAVKCIAAVAAACADTLTTNLHVVTRFHIELPLCDRTSRDVHKNIFSLFTSHPITTWRSGPSRTIVLCRGLNTHFAENSFYDCLRHLSQRVSPQAPAEKPINALTLHLLSATPAPTTPPPPPAPLPHPPPPSTSPSPSALHPPHAPPFPANPAPVTVK